VVAAAIATAVAGVGFWELLTINTRELFGVQIERGLWLSLWAYVGIALAAWAAALPEAVQGRAERLFIVPRRPHRV
jgi:hypothetical protein